jgi:hypothetical protein
MQDKTRRFRQILTLLLLITGAILASLAIAVESIPSLNVTPGFGILQMGQFLTGITFLTIAGFLWLHDHRSADTSPSLQAGIGVRLSLTGLVFCYVAGFADLLHVGTHLQPQFERPFVGPWQITGVVLGMATIVTGMVLYHTSRTTTSSSSVQKLIDKRRNGGNGSSDTP